MRTYRTFLISGCFVALFGCAQNDQKQKEIAVSDASVLVQPPAPEGERLDTTPAVQADVTVEKNAHGLRENRPPVETGQPGDHRRKPAEQDYFKPAYKKAQVFTINPLRDTILKCAEGTEIFIKANSFERESTNEDVTGLVQFSVEEYYKISDMLKANLSTTSGNKLLETGGMLYIKAMEGEQKLKLKMGSTMDISFPAKKKEEGMQAFEGAVDSIGFMTWDPSAATKKPEPEFTFVEQEPVPEGGNMNEYVSRNMKVPEKARGMKLEGKVFVTFIVSRTGMVEDVKLLKGFGYGFDEEAVRLVKNMPRWTPGQNGVRNVRVRMNIPLGFSLDEKGKLKIFDDPKVTVNNIGNNIRRKFGEDRIGTGKYPNSYDLQINRLGWINCDRFENMDNTVLLDVSADKQENVIVNIVFKRFRSILRGVKAGGFFRFKVPVNEEITLVGMAYIDSKPFMAFRETTTKKGLIRNLEYKPFDDPGVRAALAKLDQ